MILYCVNCDVVCAVVIKNSIKVQDGTLFLLFLTSLFHKQNFTGPRQKAIALIHFHKFFLGEFLSAELIFNWLLLGR